MIEQRRATSSGFISNELQRLTKQLELLVSSGDFPTLDEQMGLVNKLKESFFTALRDTHTAKLSFKQFDILNPVKQVDLVQSMNWDISGAYDRVADVQIDLQTRINKFAAFKRQVENRIARANGVVQGTAVLNDIDVFEIGDTFNDITRIDQENPSAIPALFQSRTGGILTLPREQADNIVPVAINILDSSNGFTPDGQDIAALSDNNADTWFEYHRQALDQEDETKLTLDLLIKLKLPTVVNLIRVSPLVLDDKAFPRIENIETSLDGRVYQTVRDSLPGFITKSEQDALFTLGPVGFRNQSAAEFVITPRVCQFIKIRIRQSKKTELTDLTLRQIIAIRDINIQQVQYQDRGEILTTALPFPFTAKRVLLSERVAQTEPLTIIGYQISLDGGATFSPILPDTPLDINTGSRDALIIDGQKPEARLRLTAVRDAESFNGVAAPLADTVITETETFPLAQTPITFSLRSIPVQNTLGIFRPIATVGKEGKGTLISTGGGQDNLTLDLPIEVKPFTEVVKINGHPWTRVSKFGLSNPDATEYTINYNKKQIKFGDNTKGQVPESEVRLEIPAESVVIPDTSPFVINLKNSHDFNRNNIQVNWTGRATPVNQEILRRGAVEHPLDNQYIAESIRVREEVTPNARSFHLGYIPLNKDLLTFDDSVVFASGSWSSSRIVESKFSPVIVSTNINTDSVSPGFVEYDAIARIVDKRNSYNPELFTPSELEIYTPTFNSSVFTSEREFINGKNELTKAGDYSIDYTNGIVYSFSETDPEGETFINYFYSPKQELTWQFGDGSKQLIIDDDAVLVNRNDIETAVVEQNLQRYFILFKDNRYIWMPFDNTYVSNSTNEVDTVNLDADKRPLQDTVPQTDFTFVPGDDFVTGAVLPEGKTRVDLDHDQIVKNSIRFIHVSDDINSFNDRIVTKDLSSNITVKPKPVKDVYGNSLTGSSVGTTTQRDVDMTKLTREVQFINGKDELVNGGDWSVDYENGILYTVDPIPAYTIIQYEFSDIAVSYIATVELTEDTDFSINPLTLEVTINSIDDGLDVPNGSILVKYDVIENFAQDPATVLRFYTPILYGYKLKASEG